MTIRQCCLVVFAQRSSVDRSRRGGIRMKVFRWFQRACVLALPAIALPASADEALRVGMAQTPNVKPTFLGEIHTALYDGITDDLLTAGLGKTGLAGAVPPGFSNPLAPTAAEL